MNEIFSGWAPYNVILRWALRSPFSHVICTQDGSNANSWLKAALKTGVPTTTMINGVEPNLFAAKRFEKKDLQDTPLKIVFLGRIESLKGADYFVDALLNIPIPCRDYIEPLLIGDGLLLEHLRDKVRQANAHGWIKFTGAVPASDIQEYLANQDFYVSLNEQGHISNSSLEAVAAGLGVIIRKINNKNSTLGGAEILGFDKQVVIEPTIKTADFALLLVELSKNKQKTHAPKTRNLLFG